MKFRDPKTGEVFGDITEAAEDFCYRIDCYFNHCPIDGKTDRQSCADWISTHPAEAARLMGLEVKEEPIMWERFMKDYSGEVAERAKDDHAEKPARPRICRVLGGEDHPLEVGEQFTYDGETYLISKAPDGDFLLYNFRSNTAPSGDIVSRMIDHSDRIIRKLRFSQEEVAVLNYACKCYDIDCTGILERLQDGTLKLHGDSVEVFFPGGFFPSIRPGQAVKLEDILGGGS